MYAKEKKLEMGDPGFILDFPLERSGFQERLMLWKVLGHSV